MIILDTNVVSEPISSKPNSAVIRWWRDQSSSLLFVTCITRAELFYGAHLLPGGKRRDYLFEAIRGLFEEDFKQKTLDFDCNAADIYAGIAAMRRKIGKPIEPLDAQIAAIVKYNGAKLATRNTKDFEGCGIDLINPWEYK